MKRWIALLLAVAVACSFAACGNPDNSDSGNKEPIKIEEKYDENGNIIIEPLYMGFNLWYYNEYSYGQDQKLLTKTRFTHEGLFLEEHQYIYRENGTLEKIVSYFENVHGEVEKYQETLCNENGISYKIQNYEQGALSDYYTLEYDDRGNCVRENWFAYLDIEEPTKYKDFAYDDAGNCIRREDYEDHDTMVCYYTYSYDGNGNMVEEKRHQQVYGQEVVSITAYTYHDNGKVKTEILVYGNERIEETWDTRGGMTEEKKYALDESGTWALLRKTVYSSNRKTYYTYLKDGKYKEENMEGSALVINWSECIYYNADGSVFCRNSDGSFYDANGKDITSQLPDISPWDTDY